MPAFAKYFKIILQCRNEKNKGLLEDCAAKKRKAGLKTVKRRLASKISNLLFSNIKAQIQENSVFSKKSNNRCTGPSF